MVKAKVLFCFKDRRTFHHLELFSQSLCENVNRNSLFAMYLGKNKKLSNSPKVYWICTAFTLRGGKGAVEKLIYGVLLVPWAPHIRHAYMFSLAFICWVWVSFSVFETPAGRWGHHLSHSMLFGFWRLPKSHWSSGVCVYNLSLALHAVHI